VNGVGASESDDEDEKSQRPVDIEADCKEMERRKRVEAIMHSKLFREELERVVGDSLREGGAEGISALMSDVMNIKSGNAPASCVMPINDIRGIDAMAYAKGEKQLRCKLAAVYRLIDLYGWTQGIYNHVTARVSQDFEHFLLNPFGMMYNEVTASSLVKVNMQGEVVEEGTTNFGVNVAGFHLHSAIHSARPDLKCVIHLHTPNIVAVSSLKCGLLPLSQESCLIGDVSFHNYTGIVTDGGERDAIGRDLGASNKVMFLRNHGVLCCGKSIEEAFHIAYHTVLAVDTQLKMMPYGIDNLILIDEDTRRRVYETGQIGGGGVNTAKKPWAVGELEFEALMRMLDNAGFRTGFTYQAPLVRVEPARANDVELPPTVSNLGYLMEEEDLYKDSPLKGFLANMARATRSTNRTKWMNSPNVYQKVEVLETGTTDPKKITKWVSEGSPSHSTPIKVDSPNQFVPLNTNPKEFKKVQKAMKEGRRAGGISAGPESRVLEGGTWEDARQMQDAHISGVGDPYVVGVGAASKGIIQRDFQHHATVFKSPYAKNPFDSVSADELEEYKKVIDRKNRMEADGEAAVSPGDDTLADTTDPGLMSISLEQGVAPGPITPTKECISGDHYNGEETDGNRTFSEGEGDTSRATDPESAASPKKEKKKKSGLRTPSFLKKKKKDKKKEKAAA